MKDSEAKKVLMALDGLAAYLETIRNLVISSIDEPEPNQFAENVAQTKGQMIMGLMPDAECAHENVLKLETLGGVQEMCNDCGAQL